MKELRDHVAQGVIPGADDPHTLSTNAGQRGFQPETKTRG